MKKLITSIILIALFGTFTNAQATSFITLENNNTVADLNNTGFIYHDAQNEGQGLEFPKNSEQFMMYSSAFWFYGKASDGLIGLSAQTSSSDGYDQFPGPHSNNNSYNNQAYQNEYGSMIWVVERATIDYHIANYNNSNYTIPSSILDWPAHGDPSLGVSENLAPFVDVDNNGIYEPENGDYPKIKGCIAAYFITNDDAETHDSNGSSMGIEIHYMIYQLSEFDDLNKSNFIDLTVYNRSDSTHFDFTTSLFADADIGNYTDDYFGTDSTRNMMYFYNSTNDDTTYYIQDNQNNIIEEYQGYGKNPPAIGLTCLNHTLSSSAYLMWPGNNTDFLYPNTPVEHYNMMNSQTPNFIPWVDNNGNSTNFIFNGDPNNSNAWSEYAENETAGDRAGIMTVKNGDFSPQDTISLAYAIVIERGNSNLNSVTQLIGKVDEIRQLYNAGSLSSCPEDASITVNEDNNSIAVYPNPVNDVLNIETQNIDQYSYKVTSSKGQLIKDGHVKHGNEILNLNNYPPGVYFLKIWNNDNVDTFKIIKN
ncbi:MAG: T9SS type A sorting domain-containing protein [Brumimicrobium sp.]